MACCNYFLVRMISALNLFSSLSLTIQLLLYLSNSMCTLMAAARCQLILHLPYYHADRIDLGSISSNSPFHQVKTWLYLNDDGENHGSSFGLSI